MRRKHNDILTGFFPNDDDEAQTLNIVQLYREEYKRADEYPQNDSVLSILYYQS
jgi:hypothetical protein